MIIHTCINRPSTYMQLAPHPQVHTYSYFLECKNNIAEGSNMYTIHNLIDGFANLKESHWNLAKIWESRMATFMNIAVKFCISLYTL